MTTKELRQKYFDFFVKKGHKILPNVSLIPENDPTALFISAGMHPLVPYLLGEPHPLGKRLVSVQRCLRTDDIDEVGDSTHHTFFEMLGNWSLGDPASPDSPRGEAGGIGQGGYWKREAITWSFEFLTSQNWLGIDKEKLAISVFVGDKDAPFDKESYDLWLDLGISQERIAKLPKKNNWWGPAGQTGPCGPDTEMFIWTGKGKAPAVFEADDANWVEVWNNVFMEFNKTAEGKYEPLKQKNVDTGMGVERTLAVLNSLDDDYKTEMFLPIIRIIEQISGKSYKSEENKRPMRIIADHLRAATFLVSDGVTPSNVEQGYVLRRLIRRAFDQATTIGYTDSFKSIFDEIINIYKQNYPELDKNRDIIIKLFDSEKEKYSKVISYSPSPSPSISPSPSPASEKKISGEEAFKYYATYGLSPQQLRHQGYEFSQKEFNKAFKKHQEISRAGAEKKFVGGLADHSEEVTKLHTVTHLLHQALRQVLGEHVRQSGSNITAERLRFDFSHPEKLGEEQIKKVEDLVNQRIKENLPVTFEAMTLDQARKKGAIAVFTEKYDEKVKVYSIGPSTRSARSGRPFSVEVCGGPHVDFTGKLGEFKILKEESVSAGIRRIYAVLE